MGTPLRLRPSAMPASTPLRWHRRARPLLGTRVEVAILCDGETAFLHASTLAFARLDHYQAAMSFHEAASDVRAIAGAPAGTTLQVSAETWAVIAAAQAFEAESGGIFNVAVAPALVARGHLPSPTVGEPSVPTAISARTALQLGAGCRITVMQPVWIDLGGIAKGAAVDAALAAIRETGAAAAVVNAGGDIAMYGDEAQPITVRGPDGIRVPAGTLAEGAIATSGPFGTPGDSTLVLRPGDPATWADRAVSVVAPSCQTADALTKVVTALGHGAAPLLAAHHAVGFSVAANGVLDRVA